MRIAPFALQLTASLCALLCASPVLAATGAKGLPAARAGFATKAAPSTHQARGPAEAPPANSAFDLVRYRSSAGDLAAYLTRDPGDGKRHPAIVWAHGGFGGMGAATLDRLKPFVDAGIVVMAPSWRGENDNRGRFEMFYGEVDDALAALTHVAKLPYVDPASVYVVGYSTGGTLALLVAESTDRARAVFSLGGAPDMERVVAGGGYDEATPPFPTDRAREAELRSPIRFVSAIKVATFYFEGSQSQSYVSDAVKMAAAAGAEGVPFSAYTILGGNHFNIVPPLITLIARKIAAADLSITEEETQRAFLAARPPTSVRHAPIGFEMMLRTAGADVCLAVPESAEDADACEGLDPANVRRAMAGMEVQPVAVAFARFDGWMAMVTAIASKVGGNLALDTQVDRDGFIKGMKESLAQGSRVHGDTQGTDYTIVNVDGRPALKIHTELHGASAPSEFDRSLSYVLPSNGEMMMVQFSADAAHVAELERFATASIATAHLAPPRPTNRSNSAAYNAGFVVGLALPLVLLAAVVLGFFFRATSSSSNQRSPRRP